MKARKEFLVLIAIAFFAVIALSGCIEQPLVGDETGDGTGGMQPTPTVPQGTLLLAVKDARLDWNLISSVNLTVSKVEIHSNVEGWIELSNEVQEFELLELQDVQALLAEKDLNVGTYNQLRFSIDSVKVDYNGIMQDAKLPSSELKLNLKIEIDENKTSIAVLDFDLNKSLHVTGNEQIIMKPVIKITAKKNVQIRERTENQIEIEGGIVEQEETASFDEEGNESA